MSAWSALDPTTKQVIVVVIVLLGFVIVYALSKGADPPD